MSDFVQPPSSERTDRLPGFDPQESPLSPGGRPDPFGRHFAGASPRLRGILDFPSMPHPRLAVYKVRREGWVARRAAARERYREIHSKAPRAPSGSSASSSHAGASSTTPAPGPAPRARASTSAAPPEAEHSGPGRARDHKGGVRLDLPHRQV